VSNTEKPIPVAARSKASVCYCSLAGNLALNPAGVIDVFSVVSVVYCQVEVSATDWSFVQRIPTECGVSVTMKPRYYGCPGPSATLSHKKKDRRNKLLLQFRTFPKDLYWQVSKRETNYMQQVVIYW